MRRGEGKYLLIDTLSAVLGAAAVFLFVQEHVLLGFIAGAASFLLISVAHRALDNGRIDEALEAKAEYDRLHGDDPEPGSPHGALMAEPSTSLREPAGLVAIDWSAVGYARPPAATLLTRFLHEQAQTHGHRFRADPAPAQADGFGAGVR